MLQLGLTDRGPGLVVLTRSGVRFAKRIGDKTLSAEGVALRFPDDAEIGRVQRGLQDLFLQPKWHKRRGGDGIDADTAKSIDRLLAASPIIATLAVDRSRLPESEESWIALSLNGYKGGSDPALFKLLAPFLRQGCNEAILFWNNSIEALSDIAPKESERCWHLGKNEGINLVVLRPSGMLFRVLTGGVGISETQIEGVLVPFAADTNATNDQLAESFYDLNHTPYDSRRETEAADLLDRVLANGLRASYVKVDRSVRYVNEGCARVLIGRPPRSVVTMYERLAPYFGPDEMTIQGALTWQNSD